MEQFGPGRRLPTEKEHQEFADKQFGSYSTVLGILPGWLTFLLGLLGLLLWAPFYWLFRRQKAKTASAIRSEELIAKYDPEVAQRIENGEFWEGQTVEMLKDALGPPEGIDARQLKTTGQTLWKYRSFGAGKYRLIITLEKDTVVGWEKNPV